jgi:hypothetical protein
MSHLVQNASMRLLSSISLTRDITVKEKSVDCSEQLQISLNAPELEYFAPSIIIIIIVM